LGVRCRACLPVALRSATPGCVANVSDNGPTPSIGTAEVASVEQRRRTGVIPGGGAEQRRGDGVDVPVLEALGRPASLAHEPVVVAHVHGRPQHVGRGVDGAYRRSRNPMYTGLAIVYLGLTVPLGSWWPLALWPLV